MESVCSNCECSVINCICHIIKVIPEGPPDFKFEWAFEAITNKNSVFREILPIYDENT